MKYDILSYVFNSLKSQHSYKLAKCSGLPHFNLIFDFLHSFATLIIKFLSVETRGIIINSMKKENQEKLINQTTHNLMSSR